MAIVQLGVLYKCKTSAMAVDYRRSHKEKIKIEKNKLFFIAFERDMLVENASRGSTFNVTLTSYEANEMQTSAKEILHAALSCFICSTF